MIIYNIHNIYNILMIGAETRPFLVEVTAICM